jgi:RNA polymerase sigma-70 factor (ECF subfamily)
MDSVTRDLFLAQDGDNEAFARVVLATEGDVRRFCSWQSLHRDDIDDVVQETFLKAYRGLHTFSYGVTCRSWILTIARNACVDHFRKTTQMKRNQKTVERLTRTHREDATSSVALEQMIRSLPEVFREAFVLVRLMGFSYDEASVILGCPRGTVQSRVARAREALMLSAGNEQVREVS